jgi:aconitate hydratase
MRRPLAKKLIDAHLLSGEAKAGEEIAIRIDQTLTQDATGTLVMLELEAIGLDRVRTELSVQYVDHNLIQQDHKNPDDHVFLRSACRRFGLWFSRPGNGVSHPVHQERFGVPGKTLLGSDSHTPAAGAIGMLAIGAGGLEVALAMAGQPFYLRMPEIWGVRLTGRLPEWVSAKDVVLEMLRRHGVDAGIGRIVEYYGPGLASLSAMDRHVIANMGAELGATTTVFPADDEVRRFLAGQDREADFTECAADDGCAYDHDEEIDLSGLEPLIAMPSSPGNVERVRDRAGEPIHQAYIGSSANPGYRDFAVAAAMVRGRVVHERVSFDVNPTSRQILANMAASGVLSDLIAAGARIHQAGCNGCIGMGQAPASGRLSLRTTPRNFPGRSGTLDDRVCLVSPETAAASALRGEICDPRDAGLPHVEVSEPEHPILITETLVPPLDARRAADVELEKGPNIVSLPRSESMPEDLKLPVLLEVGDDVSTDEISPAGTRALPLRSNIPAIAEFSFDVIDDTYARRARQAREHGGHAIVGGKNYGQGSSREHAALAPRFLGLRLVIAKSFARIHWQNLANHGILALQFADAHDYDDVRSGDVIEMRGVMRQLRAGRQVELSCSGEPIRAVHALSSRQLEMLAAGGLINLVARSFSRQANEAAAH